MLDYAKDNLETRMRDFSVSSSAPDDLKYPITSFTSERKTIALTYDGKTVTATTAYRHHTAN